MTIYLLATMLATCSKFCSVAGFFRLQRRIREIWIYSQQILLLCLVSRANSGGASSPFVNRCRWLVRSSFGNNTSANHI
jgi:hypothetical protein